ncbi:MAG: RNA-directed DNA polymerase [Bacteroidetes bacterium]|nr:RNA-directed DNA polymerase [Bacteroidota bacterium]
MINTLNHLAFVLKVELSEVETIIQNIDKFYYEKVELKLDKLGQPKIKNGKVQKRILNPSVNRLKIIQARIQNNVLKNLEIPDYAYGGIKKKDNIQNAKKHQGKKYNFTTDLKSFYPSIDHKKVFEMFRSFNFSPTVSRYLTQLTTYKGKLPQGTPTSPLIANLVFIKTGKKLQDFANENNLTFTSFVDDLTFSAPIDFKDKAHFIIDTLLSDGFKISHNKTFYKTKNPIVTGIIVKNNKLSLTNAFKIKIQVKEDKTDAQIKGLNLYAERIEKTNTHKNKIKNL